MDLHPYDTTRHDNNGFMKLLIKFLLYRSKINNSIHGNNYHNTLPNLIVITFLNLPIFEIFVT
jgi:hypothetical protein